MSIERTKRYTNEHPYLTKHRYLRPRKETRTLARRDDPLGLLEGSRLRGGCLFGRSLHNTECVFLENALRGCTCRAKVEEEGGALRCVPGV